MSGARQKDPALLVNTRGTRGSRGQGVVVALHPAGWKVPTLPREVTAPLADPGQARFQPLALAHTRLVWRDWWASRPALAVDMQSDREAIHWWIVCVFRRSVYVQFVMAQPLVRDDKGTLKANPLEKTIIVLTMEINRFADRFGMDTLSRFRLHFEAPKPPAEDAFDRLLASRPRG